MRSSVGSSRVSPLGSLLVSLLQVVARTARQARFTRSRWAQMLPLPMEEEHPAGSSTTTKVPSLFPLQPRGSRAATLTH